VGESNSVVVVTGLTKQSALLKEYIGARVWHDVGSLQAANGVEAMKQNGDVPDGLPTPVRQPSVASQTPPSFRRPTSRRHSMETSRRTMASSGSMQSSIVRDPTQRGMVLPFQPLSLVFHHIYYSVDSPTVSSQSLIHLCSRPVYIGIASPLSGASSFRDWYLGHVGCGAAWENLAPLVG
jgi:hypothetical protein